MMKRMNVLFVFIFLSFSLFLLSVYAAEYEGVKVTTVKKSTVLSDGKKISYPKAEKPEVTVLLVEIPPGSDTGWHLHPVPVYAYVLSGSIIVDMENGDSYLFKEGDAIFEVMNTPHRGKNEEDVPVRLVVFYFGEEGKPNTVKVERK